MKKLLLLLFISGIICVIPGVQVSAKESANRGERALAGFSKYLEKYYSIPNVDKTELKLLSINRFGSISDEDKRWFYQCVEAENGGDYRAAYLTACCILNRVNAGGWGGNTVKNVIFAKGQFEVVSNNRINTVAPSEVTIQACKDALMNNTETWVICFSSGALHDHWRGKWVEKVGNEYFYR